MVRKHNNQLPENLPQLQNLIKRDPDSYRDEFLQQYQHFRNTVEVFRLDPSRPNKTLDASVMFIAQVAQCYAKEVAEFPQQLIDLMQSHNTVMDGGVRMSLCRALILLRNKNLLAPTDLLELFFRLLKCPSKSLREFLRDHIVTDVKNLNAKHKNAKLNATLQNFMFRMLNDANPKAAKMAVDIMIELYKKNVWNDAKTVNVIATGCFSRVTKLMVASIKFFLGSDPEDKDGSDSDDDDDVDPRDVAMANKVNKKTRKREKQLSKAKKLAAKAYKKKAKGPAFNFSAVHLVHDPQGMAEKLFAQLEAKNHRFEVKLMTLDVISRLVGLHDLLLLNFYPYLQRFARPHQRDVAKILQCAAQACHELVPPDAVAPLLKTIADNFVTERNSSDVMAIGLNAVREICARCPLALDEDLLRDLVQYKSYRDRSVMMAARSLVQLFRSLRPELLHKKDRGRPTEASAEIEPIDYGKMDAKDYVPGSEVLLAVEDDAVEIDSGSEGDDDDEWVDVGDDSTATASDDRPGKKDMAREVTSARLLTDDDFRRIDAANVGKQMRGAKRRADGDLVKLDDIELVHKKRRHDKEARLESVRRGQEGRDKFGHRDGRGRASATNREKNKRKNVQMIRHKALVKTKRSFKDKQIALRNHLLKLKKMK
ncbi:protein SDA1 homolog [Cylas formicarius]|uniref:protein SDA1 homolog n=1 Tax=Cylas formicarius TaxID=197179 RepID=UPI0029585A96|nr:protein SDA1 homolog [Cylas formicarius]